MAIASKISNVYERGNLRIMQVISEESLSLLQEKNEMEKALYSRIDVLYEHCYLLRGAQKKDEECVSGESGLST